MKPSYKFYRKCFRLARAVTGIFFRLETIGRENIPDGAALVCANHSSNLDPFLAAFAFGIENQIHIVAKAELFKIPGISAIMRRLGMIRVDRGTLDVAAIKNTFGYLKKNEKVAIFPEGTRVYEDGAAPSKSGAVKIAERAGVPILPLFIPRKKPLFSSVRMVIGEPYSIARQDDRQTQEYYVRLTEMLMDRIKMLNPAGGGTEN